MLVAVNRTVKNKIEDEAEFGRMTGTFENVDLSLTELEAEVCIGHAFCPQHKNGWRSGKNFTGSGYLAVDVDYGLRIEDALAHPFAQRFGGFIYTTANHTDDAHRFRIVFELDEPIFDRNRMKDVLTGLIRKFGSDESCKDACRMFFGNSNAVVTRIGKKIPATEVDQLLLRGEEIRLAVEARPKDEGGSTVVATVRSRQQLDPDIVVRDRNGVERRLADLPARASIHCPVHVDKRASAFTLRSGQGAIGIHCSTCVATFFVDGPRYEFDYESNFLREIAAEADCGDCVAFINEQFLPRFDTSADAILVKSPKGTGKTEWLTHVVEEAKKARKSVLLVGHRQALVRSTARRLGLMSYITHGGETINPTEHYAICLDSLSTRLKPVINRYDIVIIDEIEQVLVHLTSNTIGPRRRKSLIFLQHYLRNAKKVYVLDADLHKVTGTCISTLMAETGEKKNFFWLVNDWKPKRGPTHLYESQNHLTEVLRSYIADGKRCFVCANSKALVDRLALALKDEYAEKSFYSITSENSRTSTAQDFLLGLPASFLAHDCLLVSPAVGTGVDITFENSETKVDAVFGFFETGVSTHFDIDQQLCRVRHPGSVHVWISRATASFETDAEVIRKELLEAQKADSLIGLEDDGTPVYDDQSHPVDELYAELYADITSMQRASKNELRKNFSELRKENGWEIVEVAVDEDAHERGNELSIRGAELSKAERIGAICSAGQLTFDHYEELLKKSKRGALTSAETLSINRYEIENFYRRTVTPELVELDDNGYFQEAVRYYQLIRDDGASAGPAYSVDQELLFADQNENVERRRLLIDLFTSAGIFREAVGFDCEAVVTHEALPTFVELCQKNDLTVQRLLKKSLNHDLVKKPMLQLRRFLACVGLSLEKSGVKNVGPQKVRSYKLSKVDVATIEQVVRDRQRSWENEFDGVDELSKSDIS